METKVFRFSRLPPDKECFLLSEKTPHTHFLGEWYFSCKASEGVVKVLVLATFFYVFCLGSSRFTLPATSYNFRACGNFSAISQCSSDFLASPKRNPTRNPTRKTSTLPESSRPFLRHSSPTLSRILWTRSAHRSIHRSISPGSVPNKKK